MGILLLLLSNHLSRKNSLFNFFNNDGIAVCGYTEHIRLVSSSAGEICCLRIKGQIIEVNANNGIAAKIVCGFLQFSERISANGRQGSHQFIFDICTESKNCHATIDRNRIIAGNVS